MASAGFGYRGLPAAFLAPVEIQPTPDITTASNTRKRHFVGPPPVLGPLTAKKLMGVNGEQFVTAEYGHFEADAPAAAVATDTLTIDTIPVSGSTAPVQTIESIRRPGTTHRSTPAFERTSSFGSSNSSTSPPLSPSCMSPCATCGEGYCPRKPCIAVGRFTSGTVSGVHMTEDEDSTEAVEDEAKDHEAPFSIAPAAAMIMRRTMEAAAGTTVSAFPWQSGKVAFPQPALPAASYSSSAFPRQLYAIIPYQCQPQIAVDTGALPAGQETRMTDDDEL